MASTIITKNSSTASATPAVGDLQQGELAVNVTDKKVYTKDSSAAIVKLVGSLGNQEASAVAITGGSIAGITDLAVADGGTGSSTAAGARSNLSAAASGANSDITSLSGLTTALSVAQGGTGVTTSTGTGSVVLSNSPTLVTPALGTPSAAVLTNATGLPLSTGISGLGTGVATFLGTPSSANLLAAVTDETGTGALVFANSPTLVTPALGTPASGVATNLTGLPLTTGVTGTLPIANGGTGQTTANAAFNALAPSQATASGKYLKSDGTNTSWDALDISTADITGTLPVANGGTGVTTSTGTGSVVLSNSPTLVTPALGTPSSATLTNATGLPISTGVSGLGTGVATALAVNVGSAGAPVVNGGALGTPSSGTVTNLTGTASININGTVGATTPTTGAFTTVAASSSVTLSGGTANGVTYLNGSKVLTSGSALTFDGTNLGVGIASPVNKFAVASSGVGYEIDQTSIANTNLLLSYDRGASAYRSVANYYGGNYIWNDSGTEQMRLTSTGLGIGTSSPAAKLDVTGSGLISSFGSTSTAETYIQVKNGTSTLYLGGSSSYNYVYSTASVPLTFWTNSTERMHLDSAGNLGLGVTPSAWSGSYKALQVGSMGAFWGNASGNDIYLSTNYFFDGSQKYIANGYATFYSQNNGAHSWYTAGNNVSGAGATATFTQAMTLDASGNLGVGVTSPAYKLEVVAPAGDNIISTFRSGDATAANNAGGGFRSISSATATSRIAQMWLDADGANLSGGDYFYIQKNGNSGNVDLVQYSNAAMTFTTNATERARIDSSGNLLVGTTTATGGAARIQSTFDGAARNGVDVRTTYTGGTSYMVSFFNNANTNVGSITYNLSSVAYNTSSDYRLKNTIAPMTGALAKVAQLKPVTYKWNADGSDGEGFIAHELAEVVPQCVTGEKDAVDENGNPKYQGIDTSFLVATLTAALQELNAKFDAYVASHP